MWLKHQGFVIACSSTAFSLFIIAWWMHWESSIGLFLADYAAIAAYCILFIAAINRFFKRRLLPVNQRIFPIYCWIGLLILVVPFRIWLNRIDNASTFLAILSHNDSDVSHFSFKKNGYYKFSYGFLGDNRFSYGRYIRNGRLITLLPESNQDNPPTLQLLIHPYSRLQSPAFTKNSELFYIKGLSATRKLIEGDTTHYYGDFYITELNYSKP